MMNNNYSNKITAKKSLGQNFLKSKLALNKMLEVGEVNEDDTVLEVGPGKGILTERLLEKAKKVIAIEKDNRLIELLTEKFSAEITAGKLALINQDVLDFSPTSFDLQEKNYKLIANIPYYITGKFLRKFLADELQPERIIIMVQKEIADRIVAREGKESLLSLSVKAFGEPKKILKVGKENFSPAPKVDSAILAITNINRDRFNNEKSKENEFFALIKAGFSSKRKILSSNLKNVLGQEKIATLKKNVRAEDLRLGEWMRILYSK